MSTEIRINVAIKATPEKVYKAVTTQEGLRVGGVNIPQPNLSWDL